MRNLMLLAGATALAVSMPALAKERDRGGGHGRGQAAHANHHNGGQARADHGRGGGQGRGHVAQANHQKGGQARADRGDHRRGQARADRHLNGRERQVERAIAGERQLVRQARMEARQPARVARFDDRRDWRAWSRHNERFDNGFDRDFVRYSPYRPVAWRSRGCPPGLAKQNRYCMPPGQLRHANYIGQRLPIASWPYNVPVRYRYRFVDGNRYYYRYGNDGLIYRFDRRGIVSSVIPLRSSGLFLGEPLPLGYDVYNVPFAYRPFYRDTSRYLYRYDGNAIYRVNSDSMLVDGIAALLTGGGGLGGLGIGDPLPAGYDVYNVPLNYRDTYYDTNDWMYRYADGAIYQVDPETRLIATVISLLV